MFSGLCVLFESFGNFEKMFSTGARLQRSLAQIMRHDGEPHTDERRRVVGLEQKRGGCRAFHVQTMMAIRSAHFQPNCICSVPAASPVP